MTNLRKIEALLDQECVFAKVTFKKKNHIEKLTLPAGRLALHNL
jgi:hypothetical protein